ncbi:MAG: hypothetical protein OEV44_15250 [Spirochaetota bacterium]|nr:hypothetical protein [Spirochaetota bacterium]
MHIEFIEKVLADGSYEISIVKGSEDLEKIIAGKFTFPKKLILTKEQKEQNINGLRDLLSGAFCFQEIPNVTFIVKNEKGEKINEYFRSLYDSIGGPSIN